MGRGRAEKKREGSDARRGSCHSVLQYATAALKNTKEVVFAAVADSGAELQYALDELSTLIFCFF